MINRNSSHERLPSAKVEPGCSRVKDNTKEKKHQQQVHNPWFARLLGGHICLCIEGEQMGGEREIKDNNSPGAVWEVGLSLQPQFATASSRQQTSAAMTSDYSREMGRGSDERGWKWWGVGWGVGTVHLQLLQSSLPDTCSGSGCKQDHT